MGMHDDDLSNWRDDPLVRALRAPGTSSELAGEQEIVAAYRRAMPRRGFGRVIGRLGAGGTAIVTTIALSSGVAAAAYTQNLPDPVQSIAHNVLGPIGVPEARHAKPLARPPVTTSVPAPSTSSSPSSTPTPSPFPQGSRGPSDQPSQPSGRGGAGMSSQPTKPAIPTTVPTPSSTPNSEPSATPSPENGPAKGPDGARRVPSAVTVTASAASLLPGEAVTLTGVVTSDDGKLLRNRAVRLKLHTPGTPGWVVVAQGRTATDGSYSLSSPGLTRTSVLRVVAGHQKAKSDPVRVVVQATLSASWSSGLVSITSVGAQPGDVVQVLRRKGGRLVQARQLTLDANGSALLAVKQRARAVKLRLRLPATKLHGKAVVVVQIPAASAQ